MLFLFSFPDTATPLIYTLSLTTLFRSTDPHLWRQYAGGEGGARCRPVRQTALLADRDAIRHGTAELPWGHHQRSGVHGADRKSTRLNSSHPSISYAVFCLKKKKKQTTS